VWSRAASDLAKTCRQIFASNPSLHQYFARLGRPGYVALKRIVCDVRRLVATSSVSATRLPPAAKSTRDSAEIHPTIAAAARAALSFGGSHKRSVQRAQCAVARASVPPDLIGIGRWEVFEAMPEARSW
jgi:hypothetical protein